MKREINVRVMVLRPPASVELKVQRGRDELLPPTRNANGDLEFKFPVTVDTSAGSPNFLGKYAQGPKDARFIYVNSGTYAGQIHSGWGRRAKLSLVSVTREQVDHLLASPSAVLETTFNGTGSDGGPTCASVKGLVWTVVKE